MRSFHKLVVLFFHIFLWFNNVAEADKGKPNLDKYHPGSGRLGVELDYELAKAGAEDMIAGKPASKGKMQSRLIFISHLTGVGRVEDDELAQIAMDGYLEMVQNANLYKINKADFPSVMTAFYYGNEIILASSQKGGTAITYTRDNAVSRLVEQCITPATKSNEAKCGEMSAAQLWQRLHPGQLISTAHIVTVTVISGNKNNALSSKPADLKVWPPCSPTNGGGCAEIVGPGKVVDREVLPESWTGPVTYSTTGWVKTDMQVLSFVSPVQQQTTGQT
ncbi:hypothetical protein PMIN06_012520 [Paraphaeosphaeria minitans]|uniref:Uncharacterized protein n=1 Tax=Paraphaeosphaeria minitans TaxID=565426 RepID=A0A9P6GP57_9PLEO|nr:hypothetical protein PMIN01_04124 [Paraphaeosphaeria minitans]